MPLRRRLPIIFGISLVLWLITMGAVYYTHYIKNTGEELGYFSPEVKFDSESGDFYGINCGDQKIGYKNEMKTSRQGLKMIRDNGTLKLNLAGMSREVFFSSITGIDSSQFVTKYMSFTIQSGEHQNTFEATTKDDTLFIQVKKNTLSQWQRGFFHISGIITLPVALPYYLHNSAADALSMQVFDPIEFSPYIVHSVRVGEDSLEIEDRFYKTIRYDLTYNEKNSSLWLDENGAVVKSEGYLFFSDILGSLIIAKAMNEKVFLLPLKVTHGTDKLKNLAIITEQPLPSPRETSYLEVEFRDLRAANIDVSAPNKVMLSKPGETLRLGIYNKPVAKGEQLMSEMETAARDTSIYGMSDYIQPYDARMIRTAQDIIATEQDTLSMAYALNSWLFENMQKVSDLDIIRSVDILRNMKGDTDEYTKLYTALARSIGISTQINMGLVYKDDAFRYHSWPSVFVNGLWYDLDPYFGQNSADATHIGLVRGDFEKLIEIYRLMGNISLKINTYR
ncbi:MAG: transglutaminase domain-containing protein [Candidatus Latescibacteria bacterium]|nr:transglutaminase domain-containing protein [Candidatus Latescibacterota bacterium]